PVQNVPLAQTPIRLRVFVVRPAPLRLCQQSMVPNAVDRRLLRHFLQRTALVHGNVIGLVALDFVLRLVLAAAAHMALVFDILRVNPGDCAADPAGFGVPAHVITDFETMTHDQASSLYWIDRYANCPRACMVRRAQWGWTPLMPGVGGTASRIGM